MRALPLTASSVNPLLAVDTFDSHLGALNNASRISAAAAQGEAMART
jgi:hypothetical protein